MDSESIAKAIVSAGGSCTGISCQDCPFSHDDCSSMLVKLQNAQEFLIDLKSGRNPILWRIAILEKEIAALREEVKREAAISFDESKLYVALVKGNPYILVGSSKDHYWRWHKFGNALPTATAWSANHGTPEAALKYMDAVCSGCVQAFSDPAEGLRFFMANYNG